MIGQLKEGLRTYLKSHHLVIKYQPAEEEDGGDAFTLARLKK
jgi:dsDNA-specific endonuclease/ATPase MutS2